jgi:glucosamine--fructose-6-phosphate aminotransferase (isomerizing)
VLFTARGTSDNAALYGKYLVECCCMPVRLTSPSTTVYSARPTLSGAGRRGQPVGGSPDDRVDQVAGMRCARWR